MVLTKRMRLSSVADTRQNFTSKEFPEILYDLTRAKDKMTQADQNLERSVTIYRSIGKVSTMLCCLHNEQKASTVHALVVVFFQ